MKDRFVRGVIAGFLAAMGQAAFNLTAFYLGLSKVTWFSFAAVIVFGRRSQSTAEHIFAWGIAMGFSALVGVVFAYLLPELKSRYYLFKGWVYGMTLWFSSFAIRVLFKLTEIEIIDLGTALVDFGGATIWGLLNAEILRRLGERVEVS